ncbi:MAG: SDR family NAD(P)-dependent oxidoreductase [Pseudomonadota bacterium]
MNGEEVISNVTYDFNDRVAIVTGGAGGIGAAIAQRYSQAGAKVVVWDVIVPEDPVAGANYYQVDISAPEEIARARDDVLASFDRVDFLSHNAGFSGPTDPVTRAEPAIWTRVIDVNLVGTFHLAQAIVPAMQKNNFGRIINMASLAGKEGTPNASAYSSAKAGVIAFTKSLAKELAETKIRVNCVAPAAVQTAILDQMSPEFVQIMINKSPMKRLGTVEEVAEIVMWLSSDACSFNSGAVFDLSGGRATY